MNDEIFPPIPLDTLKVASAVLGKNNFYIIVGNQANKLIRESILDAPPLQGDLLKRTHAILYLITIFQILETLPDQHAADAVRNRVDWKYALHLPLSYTGHDPSTFCEFRKWVLADPTEEQKLDVLIRKINEMMESSDRKNNKSINKNVLAHICLISLVLEAYDSVSRVLEILALQRPELLRPISLPHWYKRYSRHQKELIPSLESSQLEALAESLGMDITHLLKSISTSELNSMADQLEVASLKRVWRERSSFSPEKWIWRKDTCAQCSLSSSANKFL